MRSQKEDTSERHNFIFKKKSQTGDFFLSFNTPEIVESDMQYCDACGNINSKSTYSKDWKHKIGKVTVR